MLYSDELADTAVTTWRMPVKGEDQLAGVGAALLPPLVTLAACQSHSSQRSGGLMGWGGAMTGMAVTFFLVRRPRGDGGCAS